MLELANFAFYETKSWNWNSPLNCNGQDIFRSFTFSFKNLQYPLLSEGNKFSDIFSRNKNIIIMPLVFTYYMRSLLF